jgi:putative restriction endonuclease
VQRALVGVTDNKWAAFLRDRPHLTEVNFWQPSPTKSLGLRRGEPFLFKTHYPQNRLVGGGFLTEYRQLTVGEAWRFFGEGNGVASAEALRRQIVAYRAGGGRPLAPGEDPMIGSILLADVFFVDEAFTLAAPPDFAPNIVKYKGYPLESGSYVERALVHLLHHSGVRSLNDDGLPMVIPGPVYRKNPYEVFARAGQGSFRAAVTAAYDRRCAVTGNHIAPVLQAAHIRPVSRDGQNRVDNGLLLRSDVHTLFDEGYLGVDTKNRLQVSPRLRADFGNGEEFYAKAGTQILLPERTADRPGREATEWHMDTVFRRQM